MLRKSSLLVPCFLLGSLLHTAVLADSVHPMKIDFELKSMGANIDHIHAIDYGYKFQFQYDFTKSFYAKAISTIYKHGHIGYGSRLGYTFHCQNFTPYAEIGTDTKPYQNKMGVTSLTTFFYYDVGSYYHITKHIAPFVEFDNISLSRRRAMKMGSAFQLTKCFSIKADYIQNLSKKGNGAELQLAYSF